MRPKLYRQYRRITAAQWFSHFLGDALNRRSPEEFRRAISNRTALELPRRGFQSALACRFVRLPTGPGVL
jgi:hypothetical protein